MQPPRLRRFIPCLCAFLWLSAAFVTGAEIRVIYPELEPDIDGKEVDWIYGDYLMKNDQISVTIAAPIATRDANLTIRGIGASILDLTLNHPSNDQLSAFIPTAARYQFHDPSQVQIGRDGDAVFWQCRSSKSLAGDGTTATVRYRLVDGNAFVETTVWIEGETAETVQAYDGVRADRSFAMEQSGSVAYCSDAFFRQTIGFKSPIGTEPPQWKNGRPAELHYSDQHVQRGDAMTTWTVLLYPATSPIDLLAVAEGSPLAPAMHTFEVPLEFPGGDEIAAVRRANIVLRQMSGSEGEISKPFHLQTDDLGIAHARLVPGQYVASYKALGQPAFVRVVTTSDEPQTIRLGTSAPSGCSATVTDGDGNPIPAKATIDAANGDDPDFGPDSTRTFVKNCVYAVHGQLHCPLDPGTYEIHFSRGPEYNSVTRQIQVGEETMIELSVQLDRVVDTRGWVSTELHSHSSPSGDNTSDQYGRVENLLCEHLEFAPCTEHNRISSYTPHLQQMQLSHLMATCTGMELTGNPLPANHQNAFPLHHHPHTQNGGGPRVDPNPVVQIERLAMWDGGSDKLVQMNHPNLHQIYGDLDVDGTPDKGFRGMLKWMDVIEVHPLETIFQDIASKPPNVREMRIPLFQWMQLLNQGYRIPGVVNTDAHYNHHGSGWLRNWFASSTDDPAAISTDEMIRQAEAGHIVMSTGPFLSVVGTSKTGEAQAIPGDDLSTDDGQVNVQVTVQCPNWLDVNRVALFINGRRSETHDYTRKNSPELFADSDSVVKFDSTITVQLDADAHLIVATIGEGMTMEKVMGEQYGKRPPIAVSNPIFVDVDGNGFQANGDELGLPLPKSSH
ncbi:MAG: hypothetical protein F9B45_08050 [Phycisphaera sp. RhM]|nr:hypothetical protein [Phycisphaera sp. RhM]